MKGARAGQGGVALILVIWVVTLLLAIVGAFVYAARTDLAAIRNAEGVARAETVAFAAVSRAAMELFKPPNEQRQWLRNPGPLDWSFDGMTVRVRVLDESGKIDINFATNSLLTSLLRSAGLAEDEAVAALDAILDWRDADSLRRPNGAEEPEYKAAGQEGRPANGPFQSVEELQAVRGISAGTYQRLSRAVTVHSRLPGVNPHFASREVLLAIPNVTEAQVDAYLDERASAFAEGRPPPAFPAAGPFAVYSPGRAVSVRAEVAISATGLLVREAVVVVTPQFPRRPVALLAWRDASGQPAPSVTSERASGGN